MSINTVMMEAFNLRQKKRQFPRYPFCFRDRLIFFCLFVYLFVLFCFLFCFVFKHQVLTSFIIMPLKHVYRPILGQTSCFVDKLPQVAPIINIIDVESIRNWSKNTSRLCYNTSVYPNNTRCYVLWQKSRIK